MICANSPWAGNQTNTSPYFRKKTISYFFILIRYCAEIAARGIENSEFTRCFL